MPKIHVDLLIRQTTNKGGTSGQPSRSGSWSEGWWIDDTPANALNKAVLISQQRARFLTTAAQIIGQRIRVLGGGSQTQNIAYPGLLNVRADIPQMALLMNVTGKGVANTRKFFLRGIPDSRVEEGEYVELGSFTALLDAYANVLDEQSFAFKCRDLTAPQAPVLSITDVGVVTVMSDVALTPGMIVQGLRVSSDVTDKAISFELPVKAVTDTRHFTLDGWTFGPASGGKIRVLNIIYPIVNANTFKAIKIGTHKVGEDFFQYHGRASRRN